jgi:hypothetical protein
MYLLHCFEKGFYYPLIYCLSKRYRNLYETYSVSKNCVTLHTKGL